MSKYLLNKFLFTVDRDPALVEAYRSSPRSTVEEWEALDRALGVVLASDESQ